ncbi:hypothetical protein PRK78_004708 [Emydomyces testavorans]|uniref:Uncharacterized protein n=1 Tax=Emydomyces testavorans TaxID=2070801 RepID=A0AAF0DJ49_9EURO|nr:hypothetical protein PRK78_004708 [Emydomyces testavorans]
MSHIFRRFGHAFIQVLESRTTWTCLWVSQAYNKEKSKKLLANLESYVKTHREIDHQWDAIQKLREETERSAEESSAVMGVVARSLKSMATIKLQESQRSRVPWSKLCPSADWIWAKAE